MKKRTVLSRLFFSVKRRNLAPLLVIFTLSLLTALPAWSAVNNISTASGTFTAVPPSVSNYVDVSEITGTVISRSATGLISGSKTLTMNKRVLIQTGTYAGWGYGILSYALTATTGTAYNGTVHIVSHNNEIWGSVTGDIHAVVRSQDGGNTATWYVTSINSVQTSGTINFTTTTTTPGATTTHTNIELKVQAGITTSATSSGYYNGPIGMTITSLKLPFFNEGLAIETYTSDLGPGTRHVYVDDTASPSLRRRGCFEGYLFGIFEALFSAPVTVGTPFTGTIEHVISGLRRTGQTTIYATGDDGAIQAGVAWPTQRFTDNGDQTVTDNLTGLMWPKYVNFPSRTWQDAINDIAAMNAGAGTFGHKDWRLPTVNELQSLVNLQIPNQEDWLNAVGGHNSPFVNAHGYFYWSSTVAAALPNSAWMVNMHWGDVNMWDKSVDIYFWPVRGPVSAAPAVVSQTGQTSSPGAPWPSPRYTDNGNGTVTDNLTGLVWLKDANCLQTLGNIVKGGTGELTWADSLTWSNNLANGACGLTDGSTAGQWRLPNREELYSLIDFSKWGPSVQTGHPFANLQACGYWSSSTEAEWTPNAWAISFLDSDVNMVNKTDPKFVWAVRGGIINTDTNVPSDPVDNCPNDPNKIEPGPSGCGNLDSEIPAQANITVIPAPGISISFSEVTTIGTISATPTSNPSKPSNFRLVSSSSYEITFTGSFTGPATVCMTYDENDVLNESKLKLFHWEDPSWQDITTSVDTTLNRICGLTNSFSPFIVVEPDADNDGLSDDEEIALGTNPNVADTDGDGVNDGAEVVAGTDPQVANVSTPPPTTQPRKAVPVHSGWWLIPSILGGLFVMRRKFKSA